MINNFIPTNRLEDYFTKSALKYPNKVAVSCGEEHLTYQELDLKSDLIAKIILEKADDNIQYVGILMSRSIEMVICMLGILKAGRSYIPIDPSNNPIDRIKLCLLEIDLKLIFSNIQFTIESVRTIIVNNDLLDFKNHSSEYKLPDVPQKNKTAYAIFTSGTTGIPKAVPIKHESVLGIFRNSIEIFTFSKNDIWTLFHSFAFDFSVWETWGALLFGGKLEIVPLAIAKNTGRFRRFLVEKKITVLNQTPSAFYNLLSVDQQKQTKVKSLRYIVLGGEKLKMERLKPWIEKYGFSPKIINGYGVTEATIFTSFKTLDFQDFTNTSLSPIGKAIPKSRIILLDEKGQRGNKGEICISGYGLSDGYLNNNELNKEKFTTIISDNVYTKIYKTGDLAFVDHGILYFIGRNDKQIKFKGYRIEPEEIENITVSHPRISRSIVLVYKGTKFDRLVNILEPLDSMNQEEELHVIHEIRNMAENLLPFYMIPSEFILKKIPLTINGKVDYEELLEKNNPQNNIV